MFVCVVGSVIALSGVADGVVQAKLQGHWLEYDPAKPVGKQVGPGEGMEWEFSFGGKSSYVCSTDHGNESQQWTGLPVLNTRADPTWLDVRFGDNAEKRVHLGIVRFDGDRVIWATGAVVDAKDYDAAAGNVKGRPKTFDRPVVGRVSVTVLRPSK